MVVALGSAVFLRAALVEHDGVEAKAVDSILDRLDALLRSPHADAMSELKSGIGITRLGTRLRVMNRLEKLPVAQSLSLLTS